ncbi:hypothetical protein [Neobacillus sp. LXY-1]|uniref:hypothetical protein n=1 Tax=Neobacillus sp. LXY-1 TaxID=3379133 RepID=UPI003EE28A26
MFLRLIRLLGVFICGYLVIKWITVQHPFILGDFFIELVIHPLEFFAATLAFFLGVIFTGRVFRDLIHTLGKIFSKQKEQKWYFLFNSIGCLVVFFFLFQLGWEHSLLILCVSVIYSVASINM